MKITSEVVKVFDTEPFQAGDGDLFRFRLEVSRELDSGIFRGTVYRLEFYRLQPTFPQQDGKPPDWHDDALVHVVDSNFDTALLTGSSVDDVLDLFLRAVTDRFG